MFPVYMYGLVSNQISYVMYTGCHEEHLCHEWSHLFDSMFFILRPHTPQHITSDLTLTFGWTWRTHDQVENRFPISKSLSRLTAITCKHVVYIIGYFILINEVNL